MSDYTVHNPFSRGMKVLIPAGTLVQSYNPSQDRRRALRRSMTVTVHSASSGWIDTIYASEVGNGFVRLPQITWPGSGGYWQDVQVTPELCVANGVDVPVIPTIDTAYINLEVVPSYADGACDRWAGPVARVRRSEPERLSA